MSPIKPSYRAKTKDGWKGALPFLVCAAAVACSAGSGKSRQAVPSFPIGIYGVDDPGRLERLQADGFDSFQTYDSDPKRLGELAKEAKRRGMTMVVAPDQLRQGPVSATKGWPVEAWYLQDEPDVAKTPPAELEAVSKKTRDWDPERPRTFVIGEGAPAKTYAQIADVLMLDWYPVPHLKLDSVADQLDLAVKYLPAGKPLWMVVQAFDWTDYPQHDPKKPRVGRFPDHREIRFMSYISIVHGAAGLFYFTLSRPGGKTLFDYPELWQAVARVAAEIKSLKPVLENGKSEPLPFAPVHAGLEAKAWRYQGRDYVVLLNRREGSLEPLPRELLKFEWRPLFEPRRRAADLLQRLGDDYYLRPYQVLVFEGPIRWRDLLGRG